MPRAPRNRRPNVLRLIYPFWTAGKDWQAWGLLVFCVAYSVGGVYLAVRTNTLAGALIDAMVKRQWSALWPVLLNTLGIGMAALIGSIASYAALAMLNLRWRTWMTHHYLNAWTRNGAYYTLERDELISNADERISQDIQTFLQDTLTLSFNLLSVIITVVAFTAVLWNLSGTLRFTLFGYRVSIAGYMVYVAFLYQAISFLITHYSGRALIRLLSDKQTVEADFRYRGMQLRENAEQVAFYGGGRREQEHLRELFQNILANWKSIIMVTSRMMFFQGVYVQSRSLVPTVAALPQYLAAKITLGAVTRITGAFNQLSEALSFFSQAYQTFSEWLAVGQRLSDLSMVLSLADGGGSNILIARRPEPCIDVDGLSLRLPSGEAMATIPSLKINRGEHWLIRGRSGAGKSTLLRAIAGMWPYGTGTVRLPQSESLMFLPQRSYIPSGTLKAALCYPSNPADFDDGRCRAVLEDCMLGLYAHSLEHEGRWQQKLSGGEQQRLAIARAILHRPAFLFLDEATSAQDGKSEQELYRLLLDHLSGSAIISVAHHEALEAFHERVVVLTRSEAKVQDLNESELAAGIATNELRFAAT